MNDETLTLFVMDSERDFTGKRAIGSFYELAAISYPVKSNAMINAMVDKRRIKTDWYFIIQDDERIDEMLYAALPTFMTMCMGKDYISFYKKMNDKTNHLFPRMFKKYVRLPECGFLPIGFDPEKNETCLNGWILENDKS